MTLPNWIVNLLVAILGAVIVYTGVLGYKAGVMHGRLILLEDIVKNCCFHEEGR